MEMLRARGGTNAVVQVPNLSTNNLLQKFLIASNHSCHRDSENREEAKKKYEEDDKDIELTLGLSLNGQFGTDPRSRKRKNTESGRSSSIPEGFIFDGQRSGDVYGGDKRQTVGHGVSDMFQLDRTRSLPVEPETKRKRTEKTRELMAFNAPPPTKELEQKDRFLVPGPVNGRGKNGNTTDKDNQKVSGMVEKARYILEDMPCVSTRDVGADGKRVEGFLYWYGGNTEEVKIVCVCHGSFLSPAEFVRHGGGTVSAADVMINPLRHIVVKLPPSL
ncbi:Ninja-family protein AFP4 [Hirschfeldia incana]|nr:Ninja-family protein AFP4 [Hirschfeldia incana]